MGERSSRQQSSLLGILQHSLTSWAEAVGLVWCVASTSRTAWERGGQRGYAVCALLLNHAAWRTHRETVKTNHLLRVDSSGFLHNKFSHESTNVNAIFMLVFGEESKSILPSRLMRNFPELVTVSDGKSRGRELVSVVREVIMSSVSWEQVEVGSSWRDYRRKTLCLFLLFIIQSK